jgi:hypothetical protein
VTLTFPETKIAWTPNAPSQIAFKYTLQNILLVDPLNKSGEWTSDG